MADYSVPEIQEDIITPALAVGTMAHLTPYPAIEKHMVQLGFPATRVENWQEKGIEKLGEMLKKYRSLQVYMDICVKCGACADKCHYYLGTQDANNMPVQRAELMRGVYRRYFTPAGKLFPGVVNAVDFDEEALQKWFTYFHQCSQCRRCSVFCPYGIDTAEITMAAREIMDAIGVGHKYSAEIIAKVHEVGNNLGIPKPALRGTLDFLESDMLETTGHEVRLPLDEEGADVLLVAPSADFFSEPHIQSLMGYAKVFHQSGIRYTISSIGAEAANFGMFIGSFEQKQKIAKRIADQARASGKPEAIIEKMVEGRIRKYYEEVVLLEQVWVHDGESRVKEVVKKAGLKLSGFARFHLGEGIEKQQGDFAAEVAAAAGKA